VLPARLGNGATEVEIVASKRNLTIDKAKGKVLYEQDRGRQTDHYRTCEFDYAELVAAVGKDNLDKELRLQVSVGASRRESPKPGAKGTAQPAGGFTFEFFTCKVARVISVK